jgi:hypothetical protein
VLSTVALLGAASLLLLSLEESPLFAHRHGE